MRSEKVPESPSSALQTTYFCAACWSSTVCHLMPVGNAAPPRPRRPESSDFLHDLGAGHAERTLQARVAAVRDVVVESTGIDDAHARERQALLAARSRAGPRRGRGAARAARPQTGRPPTVPARGPRSPGRRRCAARSRLRPRPAARARPCRASRRAPARSSVPLRGRRDLRLPRPSRRRPGPAPPRRARRRRARSSAVPPLGQDCVERARA